MNHGSLEWFIHAIIMTAVYLGVCWLGNWLIYRIGQ